MLLVYGNRWVGIVRAGLVDGWAHACFLGGRAVGVV